MKIFTYYKSVIIKYLQQHVILSLQMKTARFLHSYIFIQHFINELTSKGYKHTDQSDGLNAVSQKKGHQKVLTEQGFLTEETLLGCFCFSSTNCQSTSHYLKGEFKLSVLTVSHLTHTLCWLRFAFALVLTCSTSLAQAMLPTPTGLPNK